MRHYLNLVEKFLPKLALFKNPARVNLVTEYKERLEEWRSTVLQGEDAPVPHRECRRCSLDNVGHSRYFQAFLPPCVAPSRNYRLRT